jgi:DNA-binding IclR family transcriptional regulator
MRCCGPQAAGRSRDEDSEEADMPLVGIGHLTILDTAPPDWVSLAHDALTHETIRLGVLEGNEVLYFVKIVGHKTFPLPTRTGGRWPLRPCSEHRLCAAPRPRSPSESAISCPMSGTDDRSVFNR